MSFAWNFLIFTAVTRDKIILFNNFVVAKIHFTIRKYQFPFIYTLPDVFENILVLKQKTNINTAALGSYPLEKTH